MNETNEPNAFRASKAIKQNGFLIFLIVALLAVVVMAIIFQEAPAGQPIQVKLARSPLAYCAFAALENKDSSCAVSLVDGYDQIIAALKDETLDATLLPARYVKELNGAAYTVIAVVSYMNLVVVENGGSVASINDLEGHDAVMPSSLQGMPEMQMLNMMLSQAGISANLVFEQEEVLQQKVQDGDFDILILPAEQCAPVLLYSSKYRSCFNLANQWSALFQSQPPAGSCIIAKNTCMEEKRDAINGFLSTIKVSISFINTHHKKAAMLIAPNGFGDAPAYIRKTIPHCMFVYLENESMAESLSQLSALTTQ